MKELLFLIAVVDLIGGEVFGRSSAVNVTESLTSSAYFVLVEGGASRGQGGP